MNHEITLPWIAPANAPRPKPVDKSEWGPRGWSWLHTQAIDYAARPTKIQQAAMFARFWSFILHLPCEECLQHSTQYARQYPPDFSGSAGFQTWAWRFHNAVNYRLGKPLVSAEEYRRIYAEETSASYWQYMT
jgi:hypothetical protein